MEQFKSSCSISELSEKLLVSILSFSCLSFSLKKILFSFYISIKNMRREKNRRIEEENSIKVFRSFLLFILF